MTCGYDGWERAGQRTGGVSDMRWSRDALARAGRAAVVAGLALLCVAVGPLTVGHAADLSRGDSPYDDPRYADLYGDDRAPSRPAIAPRYAEPRYDAPRYIEREPSRRAERCLPRRDLRSVILDRLDRGGWDAARPIEIGDDVIQIAARYRDGDLYELAIDRCDGRLIAARPLVERRYGAYDGPRRWSEGPPRYRRY